MGAIKDSEREMREKKITNRFSCLFANKLIFIDVYFHLMAN